MKEIFCLKVRGRLLGEVKGEVRSRASLIHCTFRAVGDKQIRAFSYINVSEDHKRQVRIYELTTAETDVGVPHPRATLDV